MESVRLVTKEINPLQEFNTPEILSQNLRKQSSDMQSSSQLTVKSKEVLSIMYNSGLIPIQP